MPLITALFLTFASCRQDFFINDGFTWGTTYHIVYSGSADLHDSIRVVMHEIDGSLSMFNPASVVSRINSGTEVYADGHLSRVMEVSKRVYALSGGHFDPTVAPLVNLWGFGIDGENALPDSSAVASAMALVGLDCCHIASDGRIVKKSAGTQLDFSAIAKGYGVDCVADMLSRNGCSDFMVEIGGEVAVCGVNPSGHPWRIQVDAPADAVSHPRLLVVEMGPEREALASSGNYRNYRVGADSCRYGHTIDARTGYPIQTEVLASTVRSSSCTLADALATACMTMPPDSALAMLRAAGAEGIVVTAEADSLVIDATDAFFH